MPQHVHKYIRAILGGTKIVKKEGKKYIKKVGGYPVYKCSLPGCNHFVPRDLAAGRESICWICGDKMVMNSYSITLKKPHHRECTRGWEDKVA